MGQYQGGGYDKTQITGGTFVTYDASYNIIVKKIHSPQSRSYCSRNFGSMTACV